MEKKKKKKKKFGIWGRYLENLSSGENRAGWADMVRLPSGVIFLRVYLLRPSGPIVYMRCIVWSGVELGEYGRCGEERKSKKNLIQKKKKDYIIGQA